MASEKQYPILEPTPNVEPTPAPELTPSPVKKDVELVAGTQGTPSVAGDVQPQPRAKFEKNLIVEDLNISNDLKIRGKKLEDYIDTHADVEGTSVRSTGVVEDSVLSADGEGGAKWVDLKHTDVQVQSINASQGAAITGPLAVTGNAAIGGDLAVNGSLNITNLTHSFNELDSTLKTLVESAITAASTGVSCTQPQWDAIKTLLDKSLYLNYNGYSMIKACINLDFYLFGSQMTGYGSSLMISYDEDNSKLYVIYEEA